MTKPTIVNINDFFGISDDDESENKLGAIEIEISQLVHFKNHPFKLYQGDRLDDMVASIKEHGVITPLIVRPLENNQYEILSGHNRANAAKLADLETVPVIIKEGLSDEEALLIVTETNLIQRSFSELSHSEKARILTERHKAIKGQGKRMDLIREIEMLSNTDDCEENSTSCQFGEKLETNENLGEKYDLSPRNVSRYLRIDMLINELKIRLDNGTLPFMAGVDLSFLNGEQQYIVEEILKDHRFKIDLKKSKALKDLAKGRGFSYIKVHEIISGKHSLKNKSTKFSAKFTKSVIKDYVNEERGVKELEELMLRLLEEYFSKEEDFYETGE